MVAFAGRTLARGMAEGGEGEQTCSYHQWRGGVYRDGHMRGFVVAGPTSDPEPVIFSRQFSSHF